MEIDLKDMKFSECESNKDQRDRLKFISVEHLNSSLLKYFIKEKDAIFIYAKNNEEHKDEAYVQGGL